MKATNPILYSFRRCPYAMARTYGADNQRKRKCAFAKSSCEDKPDEMLAASPKGTVPVLIDGDTVIDESIAVMRWALERNDPEDWLGQEGAILIEEADGPFKTSPRSI